MTSVAGPTSVSGQSKKQQLALYRQYVYGKGSLSTKKGKAIDAGIVEKESRKNFAVGPVDRFRHRTRYFSPGVAW